MILSVLTHSGPQWLRQRDNATHCGAKGGHEMKVQNLEIGCTALNRSLVSKKPVTSDRLVIWNFGRCQKGPFGPTNQSESGMIVAAMRPQDHFSRPPSKCK